MARLHPDQVACNVCGVDYFPDSRHECAGSPKSLLRRIRELERRVEYLEATRPTYGEK